MLLQGAGEGQHLRLTARQAGKPDQPEYAGAGLHDQGIARMEPGMVNNGSKAICGPAVGQQIEHVDVVSLALGDAGGKRAGLRDCFTGFCDITGRLVCPRQPGNPERKVRIFRHNRLKGFDHARRAFEQLVNCCHIKVAGLCRRGRNRVVVSVSQQVRSLLGFKDHPDLGLARHQVIRAFPAWQRGDALAPFQDMRIVVEINTQFAVIEHVPGQ